eukprot:15456567-Alexandrium_andersonii.AAC.3
MAQFFRFGGRAVKPARRTSRRRESRKRAPRARALCPVGHACAARLWLRLAPAWCTQAGSRIQSFRIYDGSGPGFRFLAQGFRAHVQGSWFEVQGFGPRAQGPGLRVQGAGLRFQGIQGAGSRVQ